MLYIDFETRSEVDLIFHGLRRYAVDPTTEAICMAYAFDDDEIEFWWADEPFPQKLKNYFITGEITAHNAGFEQAICDHVLSRTHGVTAPKNEQWRCSMAMGLTAFLTG